MIQTIRFAHILNLLVLAAAVLLPGAPAVAQTEKPPYQLTGFHAIHGSAFMDAIKLSEERSIGRVSDIEWGNFDGKPGEEMMLVGQDGVAFFERGEISPKATFQFDSKPNSWMMAIDINGDGVSEFYDRGGDPSNPQYTPRVFDSSGKTVWAYSKDRRPIGMMPWQRALRAQTEFLVMCENSLDLLDMTGRLQGVMTIKGPLKYATLNDVNRDSILDMITMTTGGELSVRNTQGTVLHQGVMQQLPTWFCVAPGPGDRGRRFLIMPSEGAISLHRLDGTKVTSIQAPHCTYSKAGFIEAMPVRLIAGKPDYYAVLVTFPVWDRSILYVYDSKGALTYARSVPGYVNSMAVVTMDASGAETLFTGGNGNVYINPVLQK